MTFEEMKTLLADAGFLPDEFIEVDLCPACSELEFSMDQYRDPNKPEDEAYVYAWHCGNCDFVDGMIMCYDEDGVEWFNHISVYAKNEPTNEGA